MIRPINFQFSKKMSRIDTFHCYLSNCLIHEIFLQMKEHPFSQILSSRFPSTTSKCSDSPVCSHDRSRNQTIMLLIVTTNPYFQVGSEIAHQGFAGGDQLLKGFARYNLFHINSSIFINFYIEL